MEVFVARRWSLWFSIGCSVYKVNSFFLLGVHAWRWCFSSLRAKFILAPLGMPKWIWIRSSMNQYENFRTTFEHAARTHQPWKVWCAKQPNSPIKSYVDQVKRITLLGVQFFGTNLWWGGIVKISYCSTRCQVRDPARRLTDSKTS